MDTEYLADDRVEVREGVQLIHSRPFRLQGEKFLAEFLLDVLSLGEGKQAKRRAVAGSFVTCDEESGVLGDK